MTEKRNEPSMKTNQKNSTSRAPARLIHATLTAALLLAMLFVPAARQSSQGQSFDVLYAFGNTPR